VIYIQCYRWRQDHMVVAFFSVNRLHFFERPPACSGMTTSQVICQVWSPYEPSSIRPRATDCLSARPLEIFGGVRGSETQADIWYNTEAGIVGLNHDCDGGV
jgi:hypothetical protein